jgi:hypothetical protein
MSKITIRRADGNCTTCRQAWMLRKLINAGSAGVTLLDNPAPRGSHYIYILRKAGLTISTTNEPHKGPFPGTYGRYRLEMPVTVVTAEVAA